MKIYLCPISIALITSLCSFTTFANTVETSTGRTPLNKVKVINNSGKDIGYVIISASDNPDNIYGIKSKKTDNYHAKATGDINATVKIAPCIKINKISGMCTEFNSQNLTNCVKEARFDFYKVKSLKILSATSCTVTCDDGSDSSCIVK